MRPHPLGYHAGAGEPVEERLDAAGGAPDLALDEVEQPDLRAEVFSVPQRYRAMLLQRPPQARAAAGERSRPSRFIHLGALKRTLPLPAPRRRGYTYR